MPASKPPSLSRMAGKSAKRPSTAFDALAKDGPKGYATLARLRAAELRERQGAARSPNLNAIAEDKSVDKLTSGGGDAARRV